LPFYPFKCFSREAVYLQTLAFPLIEAALRCGVSGKAVRFLQAQDSCNLNTTEIAFDTPPDGRELKYFSTARAYSA
jgi:hypothetical protein